MNTSVCVVIWTVRRWRRVGGGPTSSLLSSMYRPIMSMNIEIKVKCVIWLKTLLVVGRRDESGLC